MSDVATPPEPTLPTPDTTTIPVPEPGAPSIPVPEPGADDAAGIGTATLDAPASALQSPTHEVAPASPTPAAGGLDPFDALLVVSYGGPNGPDDVLPFMRNATRGRGIPDERLVEVSGHYQRFGGVSPINARNAELLDALRAGLAARGADVPVMIGNRNWHPFIAETLTDLDLQGLRRPLVLLTSAYASYSGCRQYREDIARAQEEAGTELSFAKVPAYFELPGFVQANVDALVAAREENPGAHVVFVTHSIPSAMEDASGPGPEEQRYVAQHRRVAEQVAHAVGERDGGPVTWDLAFCSRSGSPRTPWLEPDVNDHLEALAERGIAQVIVAPIGFVSDHMEVVFDLDTQAAETAERLGLRYTRAATAGTHPAFVADLVEAVLQRAARERGEATSPTTFADHCVVGCCLPRPGAPEEPTVCSA